VNQYEEEIGAYYDFGKRLLAILIIDKKLLSPELLNQLDKDMQTHSYDERNNLMDCPCQFFSHIV